MRAAATPFSTGAPMFRRDSPASAVETGGGKKKP
jgi:hypothetical protein